MRAGIIGVLLCSAAALWSCSNPCDTLASITCEKVGRNDSRCKEALKRAERSGTAEHDACRRVINIYHAAVE